MPGLSREDVARINQLIGNVAKGILPYHGIGSGIKRALKDWPDITFTDDRDGCLFTATVQRKIMASRETRGKDVGKAVGEILQAIHENPQVTRDELSRITGLTVRGIEWNLAELKKEGKIARVGPAKGGHWKTIDSNEG